MWELIKIQLSPVAQRARAGSRMNPRCVHVNDIFSLFSALTNTRMGNSRPRAQALGWVLYFVVLRASDNERLNEHYASERTAGAARSCIHNIKWEEWIAGVKLFNVKRRATPSPWPSNSLTVSKRTGCRKLSYVIDNYRKTAECCACLVCFCSDSLKLALDIINLGIAEQCCWTDMKFSRLTHTTHLSIWSIFVDKSRLRDISLAIPNDGIRD
jgi:hypothetical protein